jgi:hypothetical protein
MIPRTCPLPDVLDHVPQWDKRQAVKEDGPHTIFPAQPDDVIMREGAVGATLIETRLVWHLVDMMRRFP